MISLTPLYVDPFSKLENILFICTRLQVLAAKQVADNFTDVHFDETIKLIGEVYNRVVETYYALYKVRDSIKEDKDLFDHDVFCDLLKSLINDQPAIRRGARVAARKAFPLTDPTSEEVEEMRLCRISQTFVSMNQAADDLGMALDLVLQP